MDILPPPGPRHAGGGGGGSSGRGRRGTDPGPRSPHRPSRPLLPPQPIRLTIRLQLLPEGWKVGNLLPWPQRSVLLNRALDKDEDDNNSTR